MTSRGAAARYARALFDIALAEKRDVADTYRELAQFVSLVETNPSLGRVLTNPAIPASRKRSLVETLLGRAEALQPAVAKLLLLLAERDRLALLPELAKAFENRLMDHQQVVRAELVTALPLPADRVGAITAGLKTATGRDVQLETRVDPAIIGGAVARIGSTVYDGSIVRQLERMRESLFSADSDGT
jgi:F-type H+-transporting ATPase subunit delta